uniref:Histidine--tRNA ligase, chloroplastic n=1 Tax=Dipterocladia arabiensis TaxID=2007176 RepID=A0A1Z1M0B5_9FLOR|nr:Histidine-tRNA ligase [Dipterocladia arabiensis]ARW59476.1 Histidine-tRNA ligase [Dipterocladia arabiensis]
MQALRGTKDILPTEIQYWQHIYDIAHQILSNASYYEIRTPIFESTELFKRGIGNFTDIVNKEMYTFEDQGKRSITLRPEGTASIARSFISNKLYIDSPINRLWYLGPMFRYERPQKGRQRQFHQLGIECIGSHSSTADVEVIRLAIQIIKRLKISEYKLEINSIGNIEERKIYEDNLVNYLKIYEKELDEHSQKRLYNNPLRILDSKNNKTQQILSEAPKLMSYLSSNSINHFDQICEHLKYLNIPYTINENLVRGLDYYNYTAFEIKTKKLGSQDTICGGGRYDHLIRQLGGPDTPSVGWAIGIERLLLIIENNLYLPTTKPSIYLITQGTIAKKQIWDIIQILEKHKITFELDLNENNFKKQMKQANQSHAQICCILAEYEVEHNCITIKWLQTGKQESIKIEALEQYFEQIQKSITS